MPMPRITLLLLLAVATVSAQDAASRPASTRPAAHAPRTTHPLLHSGPMFGHATETTAHVWLRTRRACDVQLRYWPETRPEDARRSAVVRAARGHGFCVELVLTDLPFGQRFACELVLDGRPVTLDWPLRFQTAAHWRWRGDPPDFGMAIGSCAYVNDPPMDRPGRAYGGDPKIFASIAAQHPDLMLWLGDNVYFREPDWSSESGMRSRYRKSRSLMVLQPLLGTAQHYAIWDDHDYGPNNSDRGNPLKDAALRVFRDWWANPAYGLTDVPGNFCRFTWGDVEFFLVDDRYHRAPNSLPASRARTMFGERQLQWIEDGLASSTATFKVIACGNQLLNPLVLYEGLGAFPADRLRLLSFLRERAVSGVLFLSGDRHHTELIRIEREGTYPLLDYTCSPLLSGVHAAGREAVNPARVPDTLVTGRRNFGMLRFAGSRKERRVVLECRGVDGALIWSRTLTAAELGVRP